MKKIILVICVLYIGSYTYSQECLANGNFNDACLDTEGTYPTWTSDCGNDWIRSHGSPQINQYSAPFPAAPYKYAYMWAKASEGEGMFTSYAFQANHTYKIELLANTALYLYNIPGRSLGKIFAYAVNGLTKGPFQYGGAPPNVNSANIQLIGEYEVAELQDWFNISFTFSANKNYSQLWIYPVGETNQDQMNLGVKTVSVCKDTCSGVITYSNGAQVLPIGEYRASKINIGSTAGTGGNGTVTAAAYYTTNLIASEEITFYPETLILMGQLGGSVGEFTASIVPCLPTNTRKREMKAADSSVVLHNLHYKLNQNNKMFKVYPGASNGIFTIKFLSNAGDDTQFMIYDISGRKIHRQIVTKSQNNLVSVDLAHQPNGVYVIQVISNGEVASEKIILNK